MSSKLSPLMLSRFPDYPVEGIGFVQYHFINRIPVSCLA
jgi:hypothetical protein